MNLCALHNSFPNGFKIKQSKVKLHKLSCTKLSWLSKKEEKKNSTESKTVASTARVGPDEMEIINPLAHDVDKLMVKSESRWTALTTALNHSVATLMNNYQIFVPLMMVILVVLDHFDQKLFGQKENLQHEDSKRIFGHIRANNNHPFFPESANITKITPL